MRLLVAAIFPQRGTRVSAVNCTAFLRASHRWMNWIGNSMLNETESDYRRYPHPQEGSNIHAAKEQAAAMLMPQSIPSTNQQISCDQVAWLGDILDRHCHAVTQSNPSISRAKGIR